MKDYSQDFYIGLIWLLQNYHHYFLSFQNPCRIFPIPWPFSSTYFILKTSPSLITISMILAFSLETQLQHFFSPSYTYSSLIHHDFSSPHSDMSLLSYLYSLDSVTHHNHSIHLSSTHYICLANSNLNQTLPALCLNLAGWSLN